MSCVSRPYATTLAATVTALLFLAPSHPALARKRKQLPPLCATGRFASQGGPIVTGALATARADAFVIGDKRVAVDNICPPTAPRVLKATKKGTLVRAAWRSCEDLRGVKLRALIVPACTQMRGTLSGRKGKKKFRLFSKASG